MRDTPLDWTDIPYLVRPMQVADIEQVMPIERASFTSPWPASAFEYDLLHNRHAHYFVVTPRPAPESGEPAHVSWLNRLLRTTPPPAPAPGPVLGYAGFWALVDEAHLANIAVASEWRGRGLGELLLVTVIDRAVELGMAVVTLEVRVSNLRAQKLYRKYGFEVVGERRHYYSDNGENAYIMTTGIITSAAYQRRLAELKEALHAKLRAQAAPPASSPEE